jgi:hypothetical protein
MTTAHVTYQRLSRGRMHHHYSIAVNGTAVTATKRDSSAEAKEAAELASRVLQAAGLTVTVSELPQL